MRYINAILRDERGQDTFEYILVAGTIAIVIVGILIAAFEVIIPSFLDLTCPSVDPLGPDLGDPECID